jgi:hypothetical protein
MIGIIADFPVREAPVITFKTPGLNSTTRGANSDSYDGRKRLPRAWHSRINIILVHNIIRRTCSCTICMLLLTIYTVAYSGQKQLNPVARYQFAISVRLYTLYCTAGCVANLSTLQLILLHHWSKGDNSTHSQKDRGFWYTSDKS